VAEDLEELESGESPENELEEVEELETDEIPDDEVEEIDVQEVPEDELEELKYPGDAEKLESEVDYIKNERILADEFNNMLSEMDRYYNQYILIPKGSYIIGGKDLKRNGRTSENVDIKTFYFGKFPVTNALFEIFIEKTGYITTAERTGHGTVYYGRYQNIVDDRTGLKTLNWNSAIEARLIEGACWYQPAGPGSTLYNKRNHPVVQVSLEDAKAFAKWTGKRIPTEAQWEAATRTLKGYTFPWGKENKTGCCNIEDSCIGDTTPVDKYPGNENSLGIMDILGNVMEWTIDNNQPSAGEKHNPLHILKGGSWISGNDLSLYDRSFSEPGVTSNILGFRCIVC
jgi:formylglycine-generating enzyme required for sulfatase activity